MTSSEAIDSTDPGGSGAVVELTPKEMQIRLEAEIDERIAKRRNPELDEFDVIRQARQMRDEHSRGISDARAAGRTGLEERNSAARQAREQMEAMRNPEFRSGVVAAQQRQERIWERRRARSEWAQNHSSGDPYPG